MVTQEAQRRVIVPYGSPDNISVYINSILYNTYTNIKAIKKLNQVSNVELTLDDVFDSDTNVKKGNILLIMTNNKLFQKYTITSVKNISDGVTKVLGIGSGEYTLLQRTVTRDVENESKFTDSTSANVVTQTCSGVIDVGTNTELGNITIRADYDNKLKLLSNMTKTLNGDWWFDHANTVTYAVDRFNVSDYRGTQTSVFTLNISGNDQNMEESSREQDYENLWNDVRLLGFGDGVLQLTSRCFHATDNRTTLSADITATATTINFVDGSVFSSGDIVWIGMEKVTLTTVTANQATDCVRGVTGNGAIDAYLHKSGISCYLYTRSGTTYDNANPEAGSSIDTHGINQKVIQDTTILNQNALDFAAQKILSDHLELVIRIQCLMMDLYDTLDEMDIGDVVTLNDSDIGLSSSEYRVFGFELTVDEDWEDLKIEISNGYTTVTEELKGTQIDTDNLTRYMQGAPNVISIQSYENAAYSADPDIDDSNAMRMRFRVWDKTIAIKNAILDFKISKFRAYTDTSATATGGTAHSHSLTGVTSSINTEAGEDDYDTGSLSTGTLTTAGTWYTIGAFTRDTSVQSNQVLTGSIRCTTTGKEQTYLFRARSSVGGTVFPTTGVLPSVTLQGISSVANVTINTFSNNPSATLWLEVSAVTYNSTPIEWNASYQGEGTHTHGYTGESTVTEAAHTHPIALTPGIYRHDKTPTVKVQIGIDDDWAATKSYLNSGSAYTYGTPSPIDFTTELKSLVGDLSSTKRIRIQFEPQTATNTCRIEANADIFVHLSSD